MSVATENQERHSFRWSVYLLILTTAAALSMANIINARSLLSANDRSRWCTVWSLVEKGTYQIDLIDAQRGWTTIDKVRHNGHFYSTKPPLLPTMVAGVYWGVKKVTGWSLYGDTNQTSRAILIIVNLLPMLVALYVLVQMLERYARSEWSRIYILLAASLATMLTPFLVTLNNHTVAATCVIFTLAAALRILVDGERRLRFYAIAGFFAAFVVCNELPAALFGLALFILLLRNDARLTWRVFVPAALIPLAAFFVTNYLATGGWKPFYMYYGTEKYLYYFDGIPSYWQNPRGLDKGNESPLVYFMHCMIGHHGILSLSPFVLLAFLGVKGSLMRCWQLNRQEAPASDPVRQSSHSIEDHTSLTVVQLLAGFLTVAILTFYLTRTSNYNYGGNTAGLRWTFWLIPFWLIAMIPVLDRWSSERWRRRLACLMLGVSMFSAALPVSNPWSQPWMFTLLEKLEYIDYRDRPPALPRKTYSWLGSLPDSEKPDAWVEFAGPLMNGKATHWRITDLGGGELNGRIYRAIHFWQFEDGQVPSTREPNFLDGQVFCIDVEHFNNGKPPEDFLLWPAEDALADDFSQIPIQRRDLETVSTADVETAMTVLRGIPQTKAFNSGFVRYIKTRLQGDAFRCQRSAAQVVRKTSSGVSYRHRIDIWFCDQLPFGTAKVEFTVSNPSTGEIHSKQTMTIVDVHEGYRK